MAIIILIQKFSKFSLSNLRNGYNVAFIDSYKSSSNIQKMVHHRRLTTGQLYFILGGSVKLFKDFVKAKNRPHVSVAYLSTELKTPDHLTCNTTHANISVCLMQNSVYVYLL